MYKTIRTIAVATAALVAAMLPTVADAHHADVSAVVGCQLNGQAEVFVTATPWVADPSHQANAEIWIQRLVDGVWQDQSFFGSFTAGGYNQITRGIIVPAPSVQRFRARAAQGWGPNGEYGNAGPGPEIEVRVDPRPCLVVTTTTTAPVAPSLPPSTVAGTSTTLAPPVTTERLPEAPVAAVVVTTPRFTG